MLAVFTSSLLPLHFSLIFFKQQLRRQGLFPAAGRFIYFTNAEYIVFIVRS